MRIASWSTLSLSLLIASIEFLSESYGKQLFLGKFPIKKNETNSPINIDTKKARKVDYPPLFLQAVLNQKVKIINTGKTVEVVVDYPNPNSNAKGGVLLEDTYIYSRIKFIWTNNKNGISGTTINGKGFPIMGLGYFYNAKYRTFNNSLNYRDGLAETIMPIKICSKNSKTFPPFAKELRKVVKAGSSTTTLIKTTMGLFNHGPPKGTYYAYPGEYQDADTGKKYYCTTSIFVDYFGACISERQFKTTFGSMKTSSEKLLNSTLKTYRFRQPMVKGNGVALISTEF